ncbi:MAG: amidohydrolase family protein [Bacteroidetes bacterium]|nr:amidohydrolase family protein [Bacteroidota bacterium]MBL6943302.1 amidohydrolase family protein [Bacteroidales bacterium]
MTIILKNVSFINWKNLIFTKTNIRVGEGKNGTLEFHDNFDEISISSKDEIIDCAGKFVTKSFAVGHHHTYSALARGMPAPKKKPSNFLEILKYIWWNIDKALDKDMIEASALATAMACAKAGATFVIDHHASPNFIVGSLEVIANAFEKVGIGHLLCYEITDRDGKDKAQQCLDETEAYLKNNQGLVGLHASFTVGDATLKKAVELMQKTNSGIHIHVAEDDYDQKHCIENYGSRVVERLNDFGVLNSSKTILAHCLHINGEERMIIKNSPAFVVQNTESNLNNKVGYFNSSGLGNNIMLGTDGMHSDMLRSTKASYFVGQNYDEIDFASAYYRFRKVHNYLSENNFSGDGDNNIVILDYDSPTEINEENFLGHTIFGLTSNHVQHVISNGKLIVKDKIIQTIDEEEIHKFTKEQSLRLWDKL